MDILSPGVYPLNAALGSSYQALLQSESAHPTTTIYEFTVTSRSDLAAPMGTEDNPGRGALGSYVVLAPATPVAGVREDGPICIRVSGRLRSSGTGVIIVDQADISKALLPIYGEPPAEDEPRPILGYQPAVGARILAQAAGGRKAVTVTGTADLATAGLYGGGGTLDGKKLRIAVGANPMATVTLTAPANAAAVVTAINTAVDAQIARNASDRLELASDSRLVLANGAPNALPTLGLTPGPYTGTIDSKGWVFLRWDSVAARWRKLAIGGFMA